MWFGSHFKCSGRSSICNNAKNLLMCSFCKSIFFVKFVFQKLYSLSLNHFCAPNCQNDGENVFHFVHRKWFIQQQCLSAEGLLDRKVKVFKWDVSTPIMCCPYHVAHRWNVECILNHASSTHFSVLCFFQSVSIFLSVSKNEWDMAHHKGSCYKIIFVWMLKTYHVPFLIVNSAHFMHKMHLKYFLQKTQLCFMSHYYPHSMCMHRY